jgi:hypothetical protein
VAAHQLGHSFDWANDGWGVRDIKDNLGARGLLHRDSGFAGPLNKWQFSDRLSSGEIFADMFVGWIYGAWPSSPDADRSREYYMRMMGPFIVNYVSP